MKILFIAPYIPSLIRVRPYQIIAKLCKEHDVHVIALGEGKEQPSGLDVIVQMTKSFTIVPHSALLGYSQSLLAIPSSWPMCAAFCRNGRMTKAVNRLMDAIDFDVVHVEHIRAAHFAPFRRNVPVVFDSVDCLSGLFAQMAKTKRNPLGKAVYTEETWKLQRYEPRTIGRFDRAIITSEFERSELLKLSDKLHIDIIENGVDSSYFAPSGVQKHPRRIVFSGKMSYSPNADAALWFAQNVFPALRAKWPDAEFVIVGSGPGPNVVALSALDGISVTGYVDDIRPYLDEASVAVAPMRVAVGIQNKALEAMAMGLPVVASAAVTRTLSNGFGGIITADDADEYIDAIDKLFAHPETSHMLGAQARTNIKNKLSWQSSVDRLVEIYGEAISNHSSGVSETTNG